VIVAVNAASAGTFARFIESPAMDFHAALFGRGGVHAKTSGIAGGSGASNLAKMPAA
jgi:hypothetical protein